MRAFLLTSVLCCLLLGPVAHADGWSDARNQFRSYQRSERWSERAAAYPTLLDWDGPEAFDEALDTAAAEENAAVVLAAIKTLSQFRTEAARARFLEVLERARGSRAELLVMALGESPGAFGVDALVRILRGKEPLLAALAADGLGAKSLEAGLVPLLGVVEHKEWQVASAAVHALGRMAWSEWTEPNKQTGEPKKPKMPAWFTTDKVVARLAALLPEVDGALRGEVIHALETITRKDYGDNPAAWAAHAAGEEVSPAILRKRVHPPSFFGIPVYAKRFVVVMDASVLTENVHPFGERERLQELCKVPGGRDLPWFRLRSIKQFISAWVSRFLSDAPTRGTRFDLVFSGAKPSPVHGRLQNLGSGTLKKALEAIEKLPPENDNDILTVMQTALDLGGSKDAAAWSRGPEVICCVYASVPWRAAETDPEVVGATVGLKARRRQVRIVAVGVHEHAYNMMELFAAQSGGTYLALTR